MKLKIFNEQVAPKEEAYLRLIAEEDKIYLCEVREDGKITGTGRILSIAVDGLRFNFGYKGLIAASALGTVVVK